MQICVSFSEYLFVISFYTYFIIAFINSSASFKLFKFIIKIFNNNNKNDDDQQPFFIDGYIFCYLTFSGTSVQNISKNLHVCIIKMITIQFFVYM